jgi:hypothetical protein
MLNPVTTFEVLKNSKDKISNFRLQLSAFFTNPSVISFIAFTLNSKSPLRVSTKSN